MVDICQAESAGWPDGFLAVVTSVVFWAVALVAHNVADKAIEIDRGKSQQKHTWITTACALLQQSCMTWVNLMFLISVYCLVVFLWFIEKCPEGVHDNRL